MTIAYDEREIKQKQTVLAYFIHASIWTEYIQIRKLHLRYIIHTYIYTYTHIYVHTYIHTGRVLKQGSPQY
jgi:hypothetical protein